MLQDMQNNMGGSFRGDPSGGRSESPVYNRMLEEQQFNSMGQQPYGQQGVAAIQEKRANMGMPNAGPQGSPAQGFANGMDPELLKAIMMLMQATQGQSPMGGPQQGMPYQDPYNAPSDFRGMSPVPQGAMSPMDTGPRTQGMGSTAGMPGSERSRR
tara:strand:- start:3 stop:470 length:468 start_codon:yes stop_codon:yes gene_type:complete